MKTTVTIALLLSLQAVALTAAERSDLIGRWKMNGPKTVEYIEKSVRLDEQTRQSLLKTSNKLEFGPDGLLGSSFQQAPFRFVVIGSADERTLLLQLFDTEAGKPRGQHPYCVEFDDAGFWIYLNHGKIQAGGWKERYERDELPVPMAPSGRHGTS